MQRLVAHAVIRPTWVNGSGQHERDSLGLSTEPLSTTPEETDAQTHRRSVLLRRRRVDTALLGRIGYQQWADYWPKSENDDPFGEFINPIQKFVASRTLNGDLEWQNSKLMAASLEDFVTGLKQTEGGEIGVFSSISLVRQLLFAGLLDTLMLMIHPVIADSGRRLFEPGDPTTRLILEDSQVTSKGNTILSYRLHND